MIFFLTTIGCGKNEWIEIDKSLMKESGKNGIEINWEMIVDLPFAQVCFDVADSKVSINDFRDHTIVYLIGVDDEKIFLKYWLKLLRNKKEYNCATFSQNFGATSRFKSIGVTSKYIPSIKKISWYQSDV